ncbi:uncharacterized protein N7515_004948, partial [Penicillium bovifimosum]
MVATRSRGPPKEDAKEPGDFKQSSEFRVTKPAPPKRKKKTTEKTTREGKGKAPAKTVYAQPDGLTKEALFEDLKRSYVGKAPVHPAPKLGRRQTRWKHPGDPITDLKNVPTGWNSNEPDLDPRDLDAQIARCKERIEDGILPAVFQWKLDTFEKLKAEQDAMWAAESGVTDWNVVQRLSALRVCYETLQKGPDDFKLKETAMAIMKAYRSGDLTWNEGLVTYFSKGRQISQPRRFIYEEFIEIANANDGTTGFWVEGVSLSLRLPGSQTHSTLSFVDDTGSTVMQITAADLKLLLSQSGAPRMPVAGMLNMGLADGSQAAHPVIYLQVNMPHMEQVVFQPPDKDGVEFPLLDTKGDWVINSVQGPTWDTIQVIVNEHPLAPRLNGPWMRLRCYTATDPSETGRMTHIFDDHRDFELFVPKVSKEDAWANPLPHYGLGPRPPGLTHLSYPPPNPPVPHGPQARVTE